MTARFEMRDARQDDGAALARIYNHYIRETVITFEVEELGDAEMSARVTKIQAAGLPWLVAERDGAVRGFAYAGPFRERAAYAHTLETSVYLDLAARGSGLGTALFAELFARLADLDQGHSPHAPVHALMGVIALPNDASVALHERFGMKHVGTFPEVGRKFDRWIDVGYWQATLD
ncbi:GNAT family N-acetyltransferase [Demequina lutea]|uniref:Phosphinothricin acetyltransferase n=1 Tax=Demequina lutea TaxID=431489 RepID=A0A7Y9Z7I0_9MICO|nr:GNAT family N-acetyltransferase [Demequina lutea]NYI40041.1 phosphinothricin acetyltransferase [Demequina lutea]